MKSRYTVFIADSTKGTKEPFSRRSTAGFPVSLWVGVGVLVLWGYSKPVWTCLAGEGRSLYGKGAGTQVNKFEKVKIVVRWWRSSWTDRCNLKITFPRCVAGGENVLVRSFVRNLITGLVSVLTIKIPFVTNDNERCNEPLE